MVIEYHRWRLGYLDLWLVADEVEVEVVLHDQSVLAVDLRTRSMEVWSYELRNVGMVEEVDVK